MDTEYKLPFVNSTRDMLATMVGISSEAVETAGFPPCDMISGTIHFKGSTRGQITLAFPIDTARRIVSQMLGMTENEMDDETLQDGVGEMANIVAGNVKAALSGSSYRLQLSLPVIRPGIEPVPDGIETSENRLITELGEFCVIFWLASE